MKTLVVYSSKHGSTAQYAQWIAEDLGASALPIKKAGRQDLDGAEQLVIGSSVQIGKLTISSWLQSHWAALKGKKLVFFSVSGTKPEETQKIGEIFDKSMTAEMKERMKRFSLWGRMRMDDMPRIIRWMMKNASKMEKDPQKKADMMAEFDGVKRENVGPVVAAAKG